MLLLVIFLALFWCVLKIEESGRQTESPACQSLSPAAMAGILVGLGALTRYTFGWVIIPVFGFIVLFGGPRRMGRAIMAVLTFAMIFSPWIIRNYVVSGTPFGTAGYAVIEGVIFPGTTLEQSTQPQLTYKFVIPCLFKCFSNLRETFQNELPRLGGSWAGMLFLVGLLLPFRSVSAQRLRYFLLMCLGTLAVFQACGRTALSDASPEINSENFLVLIVPVAFIYATAFFLTFWAQLTLALPPLRYAIAAAFLGVGCFPLVAALCPPKSSALAYPYRPATIQTVAGYMTENELMMSDLPWAVAWYGHRQCVWLSLDWQDEFYAIHKIKPVQALYLSLQTMDGKYVSEWFQARHRSWGGFIMQVLTDKRVPDEFPLTKAPAGLFPENLFLADRDRWSAAP